MKVERGGTAMRAAWGRITRPMAWGQFMPMAWAASHCPFDDRRQAARMVSERRRRC